MTHSQILELSAGLLNDSDRDNYTDLVELPYYNIARIELEKIFELNNIPVTNETSAIVNVPAGITAIGFDTIPELPSDLVEIQRLYESFENQNVFVPVTKKEYLTPYQPGAAVPVALFGVWAWIGQEIRVFESLNDIDLKIDYIRHLFTFLDESDLNNKNIIINTDDYFFYRVAGLCARFIMHDAGRADALDGNAAGALLTSLGISIKGKQPIMTRRRPFRASFKARRNIY